MPTAGEVSVQGRVAALLELGAGFEPDFTGRENIYLNGTILGLSRTQLDDRLADIIAFSELEEFIDRPVKLGLDKFLYDSFLLVQRRSVFDLLLRRNSDVAVNVIYLFAWLYHAASCKY